MFFLVYSALVLIFTSLELEAVRGQCDDVEIVSRAEWGARPPKEEPDLLHTPVNMTFIHHTAGTWECYDKEKCMEDCRSIQDYHMDGNGWNDIGYSFLVGEDGRVYEGRGWDVVGAHTLNYNSIALGFCIIGNFMERLPNTQALETTQRLLQCGIDLGYILPNHEMFGHRDGRCTSCPGDMLYDEIQTWPNYSFREIPKYC